MSLDSSLKSHFNHKEIMINYFITTHTLSSLTRGHPCWLVPYAVVACSRYPFACRPPLPSRWLRLLPLGHYLPHRWSSAHWDWCTVNGITNVKLLLLAGNGFSRQRQSSLKSEKPISINPLLSRPRPGISPMVRPVQLIPAFRWPTALSTFRSLAQSIRTGGVIKVRGS